MNKLIATAILGCTLALGAISGNAFANETSSEEVIARQKTKFIGIDLDNGTVYYNGKNSGRYCIYKTREVYNRRTGYFELRRTRRCGRGLYL
jgi:hypothetical protein